MKIIKLLAISFVLVMSVSSCKKNWLDKKPNQALVVPTSISDYQSLLDDSDEMFNVNEPALGELASDCYVILDQLWANLPTANEKYGYLWDPDPHRGESCYDWNSAYKKILNANVVLEGIENVEHDNSTSPWNNVKGSALYFRAFFYYNLTQIFCKPFDPVHAKTDLGLPLRLKSDINVKSKRSSLLDTYNQIITDLNEAYTLLPESPLYKTRPSKPAVNALLARIYLSMEDYENASKYAVLCLQKYDKLLNYNNLDSTVAVTIPMFNSEVLFQSTIGSFSSIDAYRYSTVAPDFYSQFDKKDLRRPIFFRKVKDYLRFWGNYSGRVVGPHFNGMATDEIYLIDAESKARLGKLEEGVSTLNHLLETRWVTGTYKKIPVTNLESFLKIIIVERRKELFGRGVRWSDLRRFNKDPRFQITLTRTLNGKSYMLPPQDVRYVFPIPPDEIRLSGIEQNPR